MTHEVARIMALSLQPLYNAELVTTLAGMVKTATMMVNEKPTKFPVPFGSDSQPIRISNDSLIPDASQRAIIYFEGQDSDITDYKNSRSRMISSLRLICWYNLDKFESDNQGSVHLSLLAKILGLLPSCKNLSDDIQGIDIIPGKVHDSTSRLFNLYSYKEERGQYLQPPYYAFGIDLAVTYHLNHQCHADLKPVNTSASC